MLNLIENIQLWTCKTDKRHRQFKWLYNVLDLVWDKLYFVSWHTKRIVRGTK